MSPLYLLFKVIHVLSVIAFLGNITVGILWKNSADATKNPTVIAYAIAGIIQADRVFTIPGAIGILIGGVGAAIVGGYSIFGTGWILWGLIFFILAGIAFGPVSRVQRQLLGMARAGAAGDPPTFGWEAYERLSKRWAVFGTIALLLPIAAAIIMITKPHLPAFGG